jgi:phenylacetic acid degradation operon negative regulatory protein
LGNSAKALLLTVLGELTLPHDGTIWTATIVDALELLEVGERNARQAVARLKDEGIVDVERHGRRARWSLTTAGRRLLTAGTERIYRFGTGGREWDGRWVVVLSSVPEEQRGKRHQLRSQLAFAGFGFLGPGTAVSPHPEREAVANQILGDLDLVGGAIVLLGETGTLVPDAELLRRAWDLDTLARRYEDFVAAFERRQPRSPAARFAALIELVHAWRRFPSGDPEIPDGLLPANWPGRRAKQLFDERHALWSPDANVWYEKAEASAP